MTILVYEWCTKWWILLGLLAIALLIAIPAPLRWKSLRKALSIPGLVLSMLKNVKHIDKNNIDFIHTEHTT